jgi:mitochondrial fission protein ELM1
MWVLTDEKPGHTTQSLGLARALGYPFEVKRLRFNLLVRMGNAVLGPLGPFGARPIALSRSKTDRLSPPWPDIVIATGWRPASVVRWIGRRSGGRTRTIQLGRKGGRAAWQFDAAVTCGYFRLPAHPNRVEPIAPINRVSQAQLDEAGQQFAGLFGDAPHPRVALLVGGASRRFRFDADIARQLGEDVREWAEAGGAAVFAVTSRRTGEAATQALGQGLGEAARVHRWAPDEQRNPYLGHLALADALVVTGESESMMAEAAAAGKPVYIYPVSERPPGLWVRLEEWVEAQAHARRVNKRGKVRPQQGLEYVCAWLIARGVVQPKRDLTLLQRDLIERGIAHPFGASLETGAREPLRETGAIARRLRELLGLPAPDSDAAARTSGQAQG